MIRLLLVTPHRNSLLELASAMEKYDDVELTWTDSGQKVEFAEKLIRVNPMINSAVLSSLSSDEFHEASEGLGIFAQLPLRPAKADAEKLLKGLRNLKDLTAGITIGSKDPGS